MTFSCSHKKVLMSNGEQRLLSVIAHLAFQLTEHDEGSRPLFISRRVGGVLAGVAAGVGHPQVRNPNGRVLQTVVEEDHSVLEEQVGETLSIDGVKHSNVVPLTVDGFPYPRHLRRAGVSLVTCCVSTKWPH